MKQITFKYLSKDKTCIKNPWWAKSCDAMSKKKLQVFTKML